jgi:hypothetical protein
MIGGITNLEEFEKELLKFQAHVKAVWREGTIALTRDLFRGVVRRTPFKTGSAKRSWNLSLNGVDRGITIVASSANAGAAEALAFQKLVALSKYDPEKHEIVISNSLHYIDDLENGSSGKAPRGMMRVSFLIAARLGDRYFKDRRAA